MLRQYPFRMVRLLAVALTIVPLLAPWLLPPSPIHAADTLELIGTPDCSIGCLSYPNGRPNPPVILRLFTRSIDGTMRAVEIDVTSVVGDLPGLDQFSTLVLIVSPTLNADGRYVASDVGEERQGPDHTGSTSNEDDDKPNSSGDGPPTVSLSLTNPNLAEVGGSTVLTVGLSSQQAQAVTVTLTFGGSATDGVDYSRPAGQFHGHDPAEHLVGPDQPDRDPGHPGRRQRDDPRHGHGRDTSYPHGRDAGHSHGDDRRRRRCCAWRHAANDQPEPGWQPVS